MREMRGELADLRTKVDQLEDAHKVLEDAHKNLQVTCGEMHIRGVILVEERDAGRAKVQELERTVISLRS